MKHPSHFSMGGVTFSPDNKLDLGVTFSQVIDRKTPAWGWIKYKKALFFYDFD